MNWYHVFECDNTVENPLVCGVDNLEKYGFNEWDFRKGEIINNWDDNIFFKAKENKDDGVPDDALQNHLGLPIYSERLKNTLNQKEIKGIQYLPIKVFRPDNSIIKDFYMANFLNFISALDYEKSEYTRFRDDFPNPNVRGKISGVTKFVLKKNNLSEFDIIRLMDYKQRFFVSEKFKKIFEENKFTGYSFREVELI